MSVKLVDGEVVRGWIEYYDRNMIRLTREGAPNLFIFKHEIMYIAEGGGREASRKRDAAKPALNATRTPTTQTRPVSRNRHQTSSDCKRQV